MPNIELAKKLDAFLTAKADRLFMPSWFQLGTDVATLNLDTLDRAEVCGTTACLSGWAAVLSGYNLYEETGRDQWGGEIKSPLASKDGVVAYPVSVSRNRGDSETDFIKLGAELFDLPVDIASDLFLSGNSTARATLHALAEGGDWLDVLYADYSPEFLEDQRLVLAAYENSKAEQ